MADSRVRPQKARTHLFDQRLSVREAAERMGVTREHLANAIVGTAAPNETVRTRLPELLGVPLADLFEADLLAREWRGTNANACKSNRQTVSS